MPAVATARVRDHADRFGWDLRVVDAGELDDPTYRANPVDRCFYCKTSLYGRIRAVLDLPADLVAQLDHDPLSQTVIFGSPAAVGPARVCIVAAGTSDLPVMRGAARTLAFHGEGAHLIADIGVAGLWRLMAEIETIRRHAVVIAVAGMEGALFSVLAGLVEAPGIATVNIDNGFGATCLALRMLRLAIPPPSPPPSPASA